MFYLTHNSCMLKWAVSSLCFAIVLKVNTRVPYGSVMRLYTRIHLTDIVLSTFITVANTNHKYDRSAILDWYSNIKVLTYRSIRSFLKELNSIGHGR